ncbi:MAG: NAD+ synthase [Chlamydiia bacterium]|nr:NAD+ synthase [Chlamydiia bacterium]
MKAIAVQLNPTIGAIEANTEKVLSALKRAQSKKADIVLFPELTLTGYCPDDLLLDPALVDAAMQKIETIVPFTQGMFVVVGLPRWNPKDKGKPLHNSAAVFADGKLLGYKNKTLLPTYDVFDERRFFEPGREEPVWDYLGHKIAVTICEDAWQHSGRVGDTNYQDDPILVLKEKKPDFVLNLSGSPYSLHHKAERFSIFQAVARALRCPLLFCNQVGANDQLVFDGHSFFLNEKGDLMQIARGFEEEDLFVDLSTHACPCSSAIDETKDLYSALVLGVRDYLHKQGFKKGLLGLSGGIDSALVACIAVDALGAKNVLALNLPSRYSSSEGISDAEKLARNLQLELRHVPIDDIFQNYLHLLNPLFAGKIEEEAEENIQSRIRGMILMAFSNQWGHILLNTGNKSEMAMGYTTLYGDMAGGLGVLHDVTKLHVYQLAAYVNRDREVIPQAIIDKAPSAELKENQTDFDTLPRFEILDPVLEDYVEKRLSAAQIACSRSISLEIVENIIRSIHRAEYKRRQAPIGIRVTQKAFSKGRIVPIVQGWTAQAKGSTSAIVST